MAILFVFYDYKSYIKNYLFSNKISKRIFYLPQDDDYNYDNAYEADNPEGYDEEEEGMTVDPEILTKGNTYTVDKGTTIRLPCYVDKFPSKCYVILV